MHITRLTAPGLQIEELRTKNSESWCFCGANHSGIDEFLALLEGRLQPISAVTLDLPAQPVIISFDRQQQIYEEELRKDDSDFLDCIDPGTPARAFLPATAPAHPLIDLFGMRDALDTGYRQLSSGQSRKLLLLRALLGDANTAVIDSPYDGLDPQSCQELDEAMHHYVAACRQLFILVRNPQDIPTWCSHLALFHAGRLSLQGPREEVAPQMPAILPRETGHFHAPPWRLHRQPAQTLPPEELVRLRNGFAGYGAQRLFSGLDLSIKRGEHTLITGPNGCGKSTLLQILTGDNPKCYANDLYLFGKKRGSGESIWEIKRLMGIVSPEIHRSHRVPGTALQIVLSGLFDSIGLYRKVSSAEKKQGERWLAGVGLSHQAATPFRHLPFGDQRLVLIGRALIKQPALLILDEPTQGLDDANRTALLDFLEQVSDNGWSTIVYVSHRQDEHRRFFRQRIPLDQYA